MTEQEQKQMGFREWTEHYEKEQEVDRDKVNRLADGLSMLSQDVGQLTANVKVLMDNQKGMFNRMNRPWQWGVVMAGFTALLSFAAIGSTIMMLVVTPIKEAQAGIVSRINLDTERDLELHMWFRQEQDLMQDNIVKNQTDLEWIKKLEERVNNRAHKLLGE